MTIRIRDCMRLTRSGPFESGAFERVDIAISGATIEAITPAGSPSSPDGNHDLIIDANGRLVLPGLVSAHTHMAQAFGRGMFDGLPLTQWLETMHTTYRLTPEQKYWSTMLACVEAIKSGTTCISEMMDDSDEVAQAIYDSGIRAVLSRAVGDHQEGNIPPQFNLDQALEASRRFVETHHGQCGGRISARVAPVGLPACSKELYVECRRLADELGVGIHTHACEGKRETLYARDRFNMGEVEALYEFGVLGPDVQLAHVIWVNDVEMQMIADSGASVVHCPWTNMKIVDGMAPMAEMYAKGINVALGFDGAASSANHDLWREAQVASLLQKVRTMDATVFEPRDILGMLTANGARAVGLESEIGSLEVGKKADLILMDYPRLNLIDERRLISNLVYTGSGADVHTVIVDGSLLVYDHRYLRLDEQRLVTIVQKAMETATWGK